MTITPTPMPITFITQVNYKESDDDSSLDGSLVAFIVIGSVVIVALIIALGLFMRKYHHKRRPKPHTVLPPAMPMPFATPPVQVSTHGPGMIEIPPAVPAQGEAPRVSLPPIRVVEQGQQAFVMSSSPAPLMRDEIGGPMGGMAMGISPIDSSVQTTPPTSVV